MPRDTRDAGRLPARVSTGSPDQSASAAVRCPAPARVTPGPSRCPVAMQQMTRIGPARPYSDNGRHVACTRSARRGEWARVGASGHAEGRVGTRRGESPRRHSSGPLLESPRLTRGWLGAG